MRLNSVNMLFVVRGQNMYMYTKFQSPVIQTYHNYDSIKPHKGNFLNYRGNIDIIH